MHRLLRRTRSADFDAPAPTPLAAVPIATAAPAPVTPSQAAPAAAVAPALRRAHLGDLGKTPMPEGAAAPSSSTSAPRVVPPAPTTGVLRTAGSTPVPRLPLGGTGGALVPHPGLGGSVAGPSSTAGLPPSIAHYFTTKLQLESGPSHGEAHHEVQ
ncbi:translation initiation factor IF-2-like [Triticum aestivum]|uniref:translation initiation factor IF-2-like n=1 Tax=Triticum aestivum TaxID=4565 RepID=UPI001D022C18|nr:translation initiation factor IF-2-like [Triticum aestivum]